MQTLVKLFLTFIVALVLGVPSVAAQATQASTISGQVTGANGNGLAGVTIAIVGDRTGTQIAQTNASGNYALNYGANNKITVLASKSGYIFNPLSIIFVSSRFLTGELNASFSGTQFPIPLLATPILLTEENSLQALALDTVALLRAPFPVITPQNFSSDQRNRITLFAVNAEVRPGESTSIITAQAEDSQNPPYNLPVEFIGRVPGYDWLTQVVVKLPDALSSASEVSVSINVRGSASNKVLIKVKPS
ncbi:MAG TPA: hypothetical protein VF766_13505, partial [Pyrinomonadaceae bacterium]